jgi:hypothetical protein
MRWGVIGINPTWEEFMEGNIERFGAYAAANPAVVTAALEQDFSISSLVRLAEEQGYRIGASEVDSEMARHIASSTIRVSYRDREGGIRELTLDEAQLASGGLMHYGTLVVMVGVAVGIAVAVAVLTAVAVAETVYVV